MYIEDLIDGNYIEWLLSDPTILFKTDDEFKEFISLPASKKDLEACLAACIKNELYEWCALVRDKINSL